MSWNCHPDTLAIAAATGAADRTGHSHNNWRWSQAYRDEYAKQDNPENPMHGFHDYIDVLDEMIEDQKAKEGAVMPIPEVDIDDDDTI